LLGGSSLVAVTGRYLPPLAADVAFAVVFGVFVVALAVLAFVAIRWGVRKDRPGRAEWRRRYEAASGEQANGSRPGSGTGTGPGPVPGEQP